MEGTNDAAASFARESERGLKPSTGTVAAGATGIVRSRERTRIETFQYWSRL